MAAVKQDAIPADLINLTDDAKVQKRILQQGIGENKPSKFGCVKIHLDSYKYKSGAKFDSTMDHGVPMTVELSLGQVVDGLERALLTMTVGEEAEVLCSYQYAYGEEGQYPLVPRKCKIKFHVKMLAMWDKVDTPRDRLDLAIAKKAEGTGYLNKGYHVEALHAYIAGRSVLLDLWACLPEELDESKALTLALSLNMSMCHMKMEQWKEAQPILHYVLKRDPWNVKAYYRLGQIAMKTEEYEEAIQCIKTGLSDWSKDAEEPTLVVQMGLALEKEKERALKNKTQVYRRMFN
ncbi:hypothetical protein BC940DRAFT_318674 [Gongronella butleri]|nr:hypothetical protein BC940DRAFT_318674 [Gongronella butleri]